LQFAVSHNTCRDDHHLLQCGDSGSGLPLLTQTQHSIEQGQKDQHHAGFQLLERVETDNAAHQQDDLHRVGVLTQEGPRAWFDLARREPVRTGCSRPRRHLSRGQTPAAVNLQDPQHLLGRQSVPSMIGAIRRRNHR